MGPESLMKFINPEEAIKRLAAAQGIDVLNLVTSMQEIQQREQAQQQQAMALEERKVAAQEAKAPMADPTKNPALAQQLEGQQPPQGA
jgi:hypothetical protein